MSEVLLVDAARAEGETPGVNPQGPLLIAMNPVDVLTQVTLRLSGFPPAV